MELIILGLKNKNTGQYKVFNPNRAHRKQIEPPIHQDITIGETINLDLLEPFPFCHFSTISFDHQKELLNTWDPCYLKVESNLTTTEFNSMTYQARVYHQFKNKTITLIEEFHDIFQYSLDILNKFGDKLGTHNLTTWVIHNETTSQGEFDAMEEIIKRAVANSKHKVSIAFTKYVIPYLPLIKDLTTESAPGWYNIDFTYSNYPDITQDELNQIELDVDLWLYALEHILLRKASWVKHPLVNQSTYDFLKTNRKEYFIKLLERNRYGSADRKDFAGRIDMDKYFKDYVNYILKDWKYRVSSSYEDELTPDHILNTINTIEELFTIDYPTYHVIYDPWQYYCCEECDGPRPDDEDMEIEEYDVDERMDFITGLIKPWDKYISNHGKDSLPFIPDDYFKEIIIELDRERTN